MEVKALVTPHAKKEAVTVVGEHKFKISTKEPARDNRANNRVRELLALHYNVPLDKVRLMRGHRKPTKLFEVTLSYNK